ncbi:MAG TPA: dihydrofolate reductase family protein [Longimicrobiales bacterium]
MPNVRVHNFAISLDGFGAGPNQTREEPLGAGGEALHDWFVATRTFQKVHGKDGGIEGTLDDQFAARHFVNIGAVIMGRNMFGPVRGPWPDDSWKGWWGPNPPYHTPVFILTHHARESVEMQGGTTYHFVTDGIEAALERAIAAAGGKDVLIGGGASTIRQYLRAGLIDEMHYAISPILLGGGERLFDDDLDGIERSYRCIEMVGSGAATHVRLARRSGE